MTKIEGALEVLCDAKVPLKLKVKFYRTTVIHTMLYEMKCLTLKNQYENKVSVTEMRMLCWTYGKTRKDVIRN